MCDRIVMLARLDHRRWISCCEHGTAYLTWDSVSIRLPVQSLDTTNQALQECAQVARHFRIASTSDVTVIFDQHDLYQVWFGGVGLCLSSDDFQLFCRIVNEAGQHPRVSAQTGKVAGTYPESPIRTTYHLFSVN